MKIWIIAKPSRVDAHTQQRLLEYLSAQPDIEVNLLTAEDLTIEFKDNQFYFRDKLGAILEAPDFVIPRTSSDKALNLYQTLESCGISSLASSKSIFTARHKWRSLVACASAFPQPVTRFYATGELFKLAKFTEPVVAKSPISSRGKAIWLLEIEEEFQELQKVISHDEEILTQEFIAQSRGTDLRVIVVGNQIIGAIRRTSQTDDFKANVSHGARVENFPNISASLANGCFAIMKSLNLNYAGIDFLFDNGEFKMCEVNWAADFQGFEKATGVDVPAAIYKLIKSSVSS